MKVLVNFTEVISDNHQGGSGKIFDRQTIMDVDGSMMVESLFKSVETRLRDHSPVFYDVTDKQSIRVNSISILR